MPVPDARTRNKISLNPSKVLSTSIPTRHIPNILLSNVLYVFALHASKEWLLDLDVGVFWVVMRVLACGGLGVLVWEGVTGQLAKRKTIEWSVLAMSSLLLFVQQASLFTALFRLSSTRVILFTHFSSLWIGSLLSMTSTRKAISIGLALLIALLSDTQFSSVNSWRFMSGYGAIALYALTSSALDHTMGVLSPSLGSTFTIALTTLGACIFALPFYMFRTVMLGFPTTPDLSLTSLALLPVIAYSLLFFSPITARSMSHLSFAQQYFSLSYPTILIASAVLGALAFSAFPGWSDLFVGTALYIGMYPENIDTFAAPPRTPTARLLKSYLKTILSNPESRKIFYFLCLNMCYMLVQMLYGVWTNSLGLISDAIHMAFDCMAIGVGLFASVMATWEPNERFTYGYGRIETLSGFANGIFLILISIFIIFEAIQRLLDPPEMNTSQLLLVSSLGLAVNLFGMFAMGGHHHHGGHSHSHSHGHSHSQNDNHAHGAAQPGPNVHNSLEEHSHSHSPPPAVSLPHSHSHSPPPENPRSHSHSHSHSHSPEEHAHSLPHNSHSHSHSPPPPLVTHLSGSDVTKSPTRRHFRGPSIQIHPVPFDQEGSVLSPISPNLIHPKDLLTPLTPSYKFTHDEHLTTHHNTGHSHSVVHEGHSHNMRGVFLHVMADTLGSVGVIISTLLIQFYGWTGFDPIASLFIATLIAASVIPLVLDTGKVLSLDVADRDLIIERALAELPSIQGLASYTAPRFWPKDATTLIGSIHIQLAPSASSFDPGGPHSNQRTTYVRLDRVVEKVDALLRQKIPGLEELTIQVEEPHR
ncbi:cation efflux family-domain-containing protein [Collybia nuda]|uniref:Cation efflux family-domain-containing protein n=1 Tax=Collybia nuda TaxID=64659 RepID=A0A9P5Y1D0_9AGAR|nr:cation efflux family-domain-containing protein [Collybia nuda]